MEQNSITIIIELCNRCGCEMEIDRAQTSVCDGIGHITAVCPNCGYRCVVYAVCQTLESEEGEDE